MHILFRQWHAPHEARALSVGGSCGVLRTVTFDVVPEFVRLYDEFEHAAGAWRKPWRVVHKAEVMALGENPRIRVEDARVQYRRVSMRLLLSGNPLNSILLAALRSPVNASARIHLDVGGRY